MREHLREGQKVGGTEKEGGRERGTEMEKALVREKGTEFVLEKERKVCVEKYYLKK